MGGLPVLAEYLSRPGVPPQTVAVAPRSSTTGVLAYLPKNATAVEVFPGRLGAKEFSGTPYPAGSKPAGVILTGVNGDSAPDLLVLDAGSGAAAGGVYASAAPFSAYGFRLARRGGGLQRGRRAGPRCRDPERRSKLLGSYPAQPWCGRFPARGDAVIASSPQNDGFTGAVSVLVGNGDGTFQPENVVSSGSWFSV
jgi:hypothetical protein